MYRTQDIFYLRRVDMRVSLSSTERVTVANLRERGILEDIADQHLPDLGRGIIITPCSDGDQFPEFYHHLGGMFDRQGRVHRTHIISLNGGALSIPEESPINPPGIPYGAVLRHCIRASSDLKGIEVVALSAHAPCGAAGAAGLSVLQEIDLLMKAKKIVRSENVLLKVACFFHVDKGESRRTYFVSRDQWDNQKHELF